MQKDSRRLLWPLLTAAMIGLPVLYVASFGPACWLYGCYGARRPESVILPRIYFPFGAVIVEGRPQGAADALYRVASFALRGPVLVPTELDDEAGVVISPESP